MKIKRRERKGAKQNKKEGKKKSNREIRLRMIRKIDNDNEKEMQRGKNGKARLKQNILNLNILNLKICVINKII